LAQNEAIGRTTKSLAQNEAIGRTTKCAAHYVEPIGRTTKCAAHFVEPIGRTTKCAAHFVEPIGRTTNCEAADKIFGAIRNRPLSQIHYLQPTAMVEKGRSFRSPAARKWKWLKN
jgi:hypothetical protein